MSRQISRPVDSPPVFAFTLHPFVRMCCYDVGMACERPDSQESLNELSAYKAAQMRQDLAYLQKGSSHLRIIAWFIFVPAGLGGFFAFLMMLLNPNPNSIGFFIITIFFLAISILYFSVSSYIKRARRWAVYVALIVAMLPILISLPFLFSPKIGIHRRSMATVLIETMYLIGHLNMIKDLFFCLGAIDRIRWAAALRFGEGKKPPEPEPWERPR